jgi:hypothetical protein
VGILLVIRWIDDAPIGGPRARIDVVGSALSVVGLGLVVLGVLKSAEWGWLHPGTLRSWSWVSRRPCS